MLPFNVWLETGTGVDVSKASKFAKLALTGVVAAGAGIGDAKSSRSPTGGATGAGVLTGGAGDFGSVCQASDGADFDDGVDAGTANATLWLEAAGAACPPFSSP